MSDTTTCPRCGKTTERDDAHTCRVRRLSPGTARHAPEPAPEGIRTPSTASGPQTGSARLVAAVMDAERNVSRTLWGPMNAAANAVGFLRDARRALAAYDAAHGEKHD